jgi:dipeptidase
MSIPILQQKKWAISKKGLKVLPNGFNFFNFKIKSSTTITANSRVAAAAVVATDIMTRSIRSTIGCGMIFSRMIPSGCIGCICI